MSEALAALRLHLRRWAAMLRWQGIAGLLLIAAATMLYLAGIAPGRSEIGRLQQEALSVRQFAREAAGTSPRTQEVWLQQFYALLPGKASAPEWLRVIFSAARAQSLNLERAEYRMRLEKNARLVSYEISLPVRGTYVQIRGFVADVLEQIPALALEEIVIKREAIGESRIDASIRLTLFLNGA